LGKGKIGTCPGASTVMSREPLFKDGLTYFVDVDTFLNVEIMLGMYLVLTVTNSGEERSGELSFSKMKFIENDYVQVCIMIHSVTCH